MTTATEIRLFDDFDRPWIVSLLDLVVAHLGKPWRVLLDRIEHSDLEIHPSRVNTVVRAIRRLTGGKAERARVARAIRALVLGHPALDVDERDVRLAAAAARLGLPADEIEPLLWADLAVERPVTLPYGPPAIDRLIAFANLDRIQRSVRRARSVRIRVRDQANDLVRTISRSGLIAQIRRDPEDASATLFEVIGPLSLFHATTVYGRALAQLVPLLAEHEHWRLEVDCEYDGVLRTLTVAPPVLLPAIQPSKAAPSPAERLARDLERMGLVVDRAPPPVSVGDDLLFADLAVEIDDRRWSVVVAGFSTAEHLTYKLERYDAAGIADLAVCVDVDRSAEVLDDPRMVPFKRRIDAAGLVEQRRKAVPS